MNALSGKNNETPELLTATELLEMHKVYVPQKKRGQLGKEIVKVWRELNGGNEPQKCKKAVGTGHRVSEINMYPSSFFEKILEVARNYLGQEKAA